MRVTPKSRAEWRRWLAKNHATKTEVWLVFRKQHTGKPTVKYAEAVEEALCFGWIDGIVRSIDDERYMHRFSPRRSNSRWSKTNLRRAERLIAAGLMTEAGQRIVDAAKRSGRWVASRPPKIDLSLSQEFAEALDKAEQACAHFQALPRSQQRQFIAWINSAKREDTRERRIRESLRLLERGQRLGLR